MYTVQIEHKCACFKKSEYAAEKSFDKQQDAYNYSNILTELMNEDFCTKHLFTSQRIANHAFMIRVVDNPNAGSCSTNSDSSCSTGSCGC